MIIAETAASQYVTAFDLDEQKFLFVSGNVKSVLGYTAEDFYQHTGLPVEIIHPGDRAVTIKSSGDLSIGNNGELTYRIITANGAVKQVTEKWEVILNLQTGHRVLHCIIREQSHHHGHAKEISLLNEQLQEEKDNLNDALINTRLKKTAEHLDTFIETITDSFFTLDRYWKIIRVNAAFQTAFEIAPSVAVGSTFWELFPSVRTSRFGLAFEEAVQKNGMAIFTACFEPSNRWLDTTVYPSADEITVFAKDVTGERQTREELIWTKNTLKGLINNTEGQVWCVDKQMTYVYMNEAYREKILEFTGTAIAEGDPYIHNKPGARLTKKWNKYYHRAFSGEIYTIIDKSPDPVTKQEAGFEISFHPIANSDGEITGVGCVARNITQRLKTEKAIVDQNGRLRLIASLTSHELRRPVASMLGLLNIIDRANIYNPDNFEIMDHLLTVGHEIDEVIRLIIHETFTEDLLSDDYK